MTQVKVWEALLRIAPGEVTTYQQIAQCIDNPRAVQAVGSNSLHTSFPVTRVIRKDGMLGEYQPVECCKKEEPDRMGDGPTGWA